MKLLGNTSGTHCYTHILHMCTFISGTGCYMPILYMYNLVHVNVGAKHIHCMYMYIVHVNITYTVHV